MKAIVVYDSKFGNTEKIAKAVAEELGAEAVHVSKAKSLGKMNLLVVGSPTQAWRPTEAMKSFLQNLPQLKGLSVAGFDTRLKMTRLFTGSAARTIAGKLKNVGGFLLVLPESFFVAGTEGPLKEGEVGRAADWARTIAEKHNARRNR